MKYINHVLAAVLMTVMCGGCSLYSESDMYQLASAAVKSSTNFPPNATILPKSEAGFYVGKSAACVYLGYTSAGQSYTNAVWLNRIGINWEVDRIEQIVSDKSATPARTDMPVSGTKFNF